MKTSFYKDNRQRLLSEYGKNILIIISGAHEVQATHDIAYPFQQDAHFLWLTNINHPGWKLIIDGKAGKEWLIAPHQDETEITFAGQHNWEKLRELSGVEEIVNGKAATRLMLELSHKYDKVYSLDNDPYGKHASFLTNPSTQLHRRWLTRYFQTIIDCRPDLNKLRARKSEDEIAVMQQAIDITGEAFAIAKKTISSISTENELEAEFDYVFRKRKATHAYEPIVASGRNALTLHYIANDAPLPSNGLVVIDIGASCQGYAADITRTYAIGRPSKREVAVHAAVEQAQKHIIELIRPGLSLSEYQKQSDIIMKNALQSLGLLTFHDDEKTYRTYFPHAVSHGLGLDVHESLGGYKEFQPEMVVTVEPGIYIPEEGIGVRIEDDILVTETGYKNLSSAISTAL